MCIGFLPTHLYNVHCACRITDGCEPPYGYWESNSGPLEEHEPASQPSILILKFV